MFAQGWTARQSPIHAPGPQSLPVELLRPASFLLKADARTSMGGGCPLPAVKANHMAGSLGLPVTD